MAYVVRDRSVADVVVGAPAGQLRTIPRQECLKLLAGHTFGRLAVVGPGGEPVLRPVNYRFDAASQSIVLQMARGSKFHALLHSGKAAFEIDHVDERTRTGWSVLVSGVPEELEPTRELRRMLELGPVAWSAGEKPHWMRIRAWAVSGRSIQLPGPGASASSSAQSSGQAGTVQSMNAIGTEGTTPPIRVVIADDHSVVRRGLRELLEAEGGFEIVAEAGDIEGARRYVRGHRPDVLVLDLNMPEGSSLDAVPAMRSEVPETQIVVLTMQNEPAYARQALAAGVLGYVLKDAADAELVEAVRRASVGDSYLNPRLGARLAAEPSGPPDGLSEREVEVLRMIALGYTNAEIAEQLYLSVRTVETHRAHIQQKLRLASRAELVRYALAHGFLDAD